MTLEPIVLTAINNLEEEYPSLKCVYLKSEFNGASFCFCFNTRLCVTILRSPYGYYELSINGKKTTMLIEKATPEKFVKLIKKWAGLDWSNLIIDNVAAIRVPWYYSNLDMTWGIDDIDWVWALNTESLKHLRTSQIRITR